MPVHTLVPLTTHPETAWLMQVVPVALAVAGLLIALFLLRERLARALLAAQAARAARQRATLPPALAPDPALHWAPPSIAPGTLLAICGGVSLSLVAVTSFLAPIFFVLVALGPVALLLIWISLIICERHYASAIDRQLTAAVGRLSALLQSGNSFRQALDKLVATMDRGPLREEWRFLLEAQGVPLITQDGIATAQQVVNALSAQTPSRRHATFLNHLAAAVGQPHDLLKVRVLGAYQALQASERRREEALTELSQMRYSGIAIGLAGIFMALYLVTTQWERVVVAYSSPVGPIAAVVVLGALALPIGGGFALAQAEDIDY
jgi:hypothetical protein